MPDGTPRQGERRDSSLRGGFMRITNSIRIKISAAFLLLAIGPLLLLAVVLPWQSFKVQRDHEVAWQHQVAQEAVNDVLDLMGDLERGLLLVMRVNDLLKLETEQKILVLAKMRSLRDRMQHDIIDKLVLLDTRGQELAKASRTAYTPQELGERSGAAEFVVPFTTRTTYYGPVSLDATTNTPVMLMGIPIIQEKEGLLEGVLVAQIRLKEALDVITTLKMGNTGRAFIVDHSGKVLAHPDPRVVEQETHLPPSAMKTLFVKNFDGVSVVRVCEEFPLVGQNLLVVTERSVQEALGLTIRTVATIIALLFVGLAGASAFGVLVSRRLIGPIESLAETARAITAGDLSRKAQIGGDDELGSLAISFNSMASRLTGTIASLREEIAQRVLVEAQLEKHRTHLAEMVADATEELGTTNVRLRNEIEKRGEVELTLRQQRDTVQKYLDVAGVILLVLGKDGKVRMINKKGCEVLGYEEEGIVGRDWFENFLPVRNRTEFGSFFSEVMKGRIGLNETMENPVVNSSGEERIIAWHNTMLYDETGKPSGSLSSGTDVTEQKQISAELQRYRADLEELVKERTAELITTHERLESETLERKRAWEEALILAERGRLARDLHDSVSQSLYSLTLFAETGKELAARGDMARLGKCLEEVANGARAALKEMRLLVFDLRPAALEEEGLAGALQQRLDAVERRSGVKVQLFVEGNDHLPPFVEEGLYRIAQEALNNALKHAAATEVVVTIKNRGCHVEMEIADNGIGFDADAVLSAGRGMGLGNMQERAEKLGAHLNISSAAGIGTKIDVSINYQSEAQSILADTSSDAEGHEK